MPYRILLRRDLSQNWNYNDPVLMSGEPGYEMDTRKFKMGDGQTPWSQLPYYAGVTGPAGVSNVPGPTGPTGSVFPYKVFTALLTQSGNDNPSQTNYLNQEALTIGQTYHINSNVPVSEGGTDFTNVGASNNNIDTFFIATGTTPIWGTQDGSADYNTGAPVATVLENTIGNIWFTYNGVGSYQLNNTGGLFTDNKTTQILNPGITAVYGYLTIQNILDPGIIYFSSKDSSFDAVDGLFSNTPIEIRVYN